MLAIQQLRVEVGARVLFDGLSFVLNREDRISFAGPNGAGKSTLMKCIAGVIEPNAGRITRPKGQVIVAFSNRMFFTKAPQIWTDGDDRDHLRYVSSVLLAQGWPQPEIVAETTRGGGVMGLFGGKGDPFFAVVATKPLG